MSLNLLFVSQFTVSQITVRPSVYCFSQPTVCLSVYCVSQLTVCLSVYCLSNYSPSFSLLFLSTHRLSLSCRVFHLTLCLSLLSYCVSPVQRLTSCVFLSSLFLVLLSVSQFTRPSFDLITIINITDTRHTSYRFSKQLEKSFAHYAVLRLYPTVTTLQIGNKQNSGPHTRSLVPSLHTCTCPHRLPTL